MLSRRDPEFETEAAVVDRLTGVMLENRVLDGGIGLFAITGCVERGLLALCVLGRYKLREELVESPVEDTGVPSPNRVDDSTLRLVFSGVSVDGGGKVTGEGKSWDVVLVD